MNTTQNNMTPNPTPIPSPPTMPPFRLGGLVALVAAVFALIFGIIRFMFVASHEPPETVVKDPLLWMTLIASALFALYGVVSVFGGYNPAESFRTAKPKRLAVAALICGVCGIPLFPLAIVGLVLGHTARSRVRKEPSLPGGGLAWLALFVCYMAIALLFILPVLRRLSP